MSNTTKTRYEEVKIDLIDVGIGEVRHRKVEENIQELIDSIEQFGLLQPPVLFQKDGRYELIAGQRRLRAVKELGWDKIPATVLLEPPSEAQAKAISFSENLLREKLSRKDAIEACNYLYDQLGSAKAIHERFGIPYSRVLEYVKYHRLPDELKKLVDEDILDLTDAVRATDAATLPDGDVDIEKAKEIALELRYLTTSSKRRLSDLAKEHPAMPADELLEEAKKPPRVQVIRVTLPWRYYESLKNAAEDLVMKEEEAASHAIIYWLTTEGYKPGEEEE